ncbi:beta-L-arabinofuranosidase domain-containing protein [Saccharicrinis sp. FJH54]|uniref:beta-L-arabinofuranosidase domain-containing protein n=1 Tax=Saccharicrinis sp. FJH54 TaxID=3344665 RepID=UPI0035D44E04
MKTLKSILVIICLIPAFLTAQVKEQLELFPLNSVRLLESPFKHAEMKDMEYILALDPDRLLAPYLKEAGLEPKAENYPNWENTGLDGHIGGHYLSALAMMYAATGDQRMKDRMDYMLSELKRCQDNHDDGYLGGVPGGRAMWKEIAEGHIDAGAFSLNKKWVPLYNIHKIYAGLRDAYLFGGSEEAKEMLIKLTDWAIKLVSNLSEDQIQDMLRSEHGGLNEVFADVAFITGNDKYLTLAKQFSHHYVLNPLLQHEDKLTGMHANTQIPKVIGFKRIAEYDGDTTWADAARFFWETVVDNRTVTIGGNSVREHFNPVDDFSGMINSEQGPETCNTYNMLKLTKMLFLSDPDVKYMDYYERALYNHILSTEEPDRGGFVYFTPMRPGHYRVYSQPETSFWCCVGSGLENHTKYGELIYAHDGDDLYVNLFIPSTLDWKKKGIKITQNTAFPDKEKTELTLNLKKKSKFGIHIRYPEWITKGGMTVFVNGEPVEIPDQPGEYVTVYRKWKDGDNISVSLPMHTTVEQIPDGEHYFSILHGPVVLAAKTTTDNMPGLYADASRGGHIASGEKIPLQEMPIIVSEPDQIAAKVKPVQGEALTFTLDDLYSGDYSNLTLIPFYRLHDSRYIIYWQSETEDAVKEIKAEIAAKEAAEQELERSTVDLIYPGEQQPESDHFIKFDRSNAGVNAGKHWRDAQGWFSYELRNPDKVPVKLRVMYFSGDRGRNFNILANNKVIAEVNLRGRRGNDFYTVDYDIPDDIALSTSGTFIVKFEAKEGSVAGGVYEVRLLKD